MANRQTKVTLTAQVQGYVDGMAKAAQATRETGSEAEKLAQKTEAFERMGRASMVAGGAIAAGLVLSTKAAIDWDSAWAGVLKTVDGTDAELAAVEDGLRGLTAVLPASHTEIAAVAEAAGQLGIETPNVVEFTKTMIDLGETTNLSSEQAAMSLARFMNIMGTSQSEVSRLGSALVGLGNNFATTESEILEMSMRLSKSGVQIGLTEGEVLGLATALSSVGIEAEAGGSAMSKVMIDIAASVEEGGDRLELFSKTAGMSADDFAAKWKSAPAEALAAFVKGLADAEAQGGSTLGVLAELGITEVRMRDALLGSAAAADKFAGAMEMGNAEFEKNTALTDEAEKRYETTAAKLDIMKNRVVDAAISLGEHLLPAVEFVAEGIGNFSDVLSGMDGPMGAVVAWGGLITSGILLTGGAALIAIPKIAAYKVALETLGITSGAVRGGLRNIASFLTGPWGIALGVAAISTAAFKQTMDASKVTAQELENALKQGGNAYDEMTRKASENSNIVWDNSHNIENLGAVLDKAATAGRGFWSSMSFGENAALDGVREFGNVLAPMVATDLPRAQKAFRGFYEEAGLNGKQALTAINEEMPGFKSALIDAAEAAGLATDDATLLKIALGELGPTSERAAKSTKENADALAELEGKAASTSDEVDALADAIRGLGSAQFDVREASRQLEQSVVDLNDKLVENGLNLDITTAAGRANEAAIDDMAQAVLEQAAAIAVQTGDQEAANAALAAGRERLIDILAPYYGSRDAAAAYVEQLGLIEPTKVTELVAKAQQATWDLDTYIGRLNSIPSVVRTEIQTTQALLYKNPASLYGANADGGIYAYANGGIESYASGGFPTGIYKGGAPIHKFAEPETIWEAYISGKPSERERNRQIWAETGARLGVSPGLGAGGTVNVSLAGATLRATIDGRPITLMIDEQVAGAFAAGSRGRINDRFGVHA